MGAFWSHSEVDGTAGVERSPGPRPLLKKSVTFAVTQFLLLSRETNNTCIL